MSGTRYLSNAGSVFSVKYHFVWCPKYRRKVLTGEIADELRSGLYFSTASPEISTTSLSASWYVEQKLPGWHDWSCVRGKRKAFHRSPNIELADASHV